jgi:hypothetical protein
VTWFGIAAGICLSSGISHLALGARRPIRGIHLLFALMMGAVAAFQLCLGGLINATSVGSSITYARYAVAFAIASIALFGVFVSVYASVKIPRVIAYAFLALSAAFLSYDLASPRGLVPTTPGTGVQPHVLHLGWQVFNAATASWGVVAGLRMARRGDERQGLLLALGSLVFAVTVFIDLVRNLLGREWWYLGGFGVIALAIMLSAQLAFDFRQSEVRLARMLRETMRLRDEINTPLQTLVFGIEIAEAQGTLDRGRVFPLRRAIDRLVDLGNRLRA